MSVVTRALNLKLVVPRGTQELTEARALWSTHDIVNRATRYYEDLLLLCRQRDYQTREKIISAKDQASELDALIAASRGRNNYTDSGKPEEV